MTSEEVSRRVMSSCTKSGVRSFTSGSSTFLNFPRFFCCSLQIEKMLLMELMICPISFWFLFLRFISFSKSYSREEFFSDIKTFKVSHPSISIIDANELIAATVGKLRRVRWIFF